MNILFIYIFVPVYIYTRLYLYIHINIMKIHKCKYSFIIILQFMIGDNYCTYSIFIHLLVFFTQYIHIDPPTPLQKKFIAATSCNHIQEYILNLMFSWWMSFQECPLR